jgi:hypothetical protein
MPCDTFFFLFAFLKHSFALKAHGEGLLHRGVWVAVLRPTPDDQMRCGGSNQMQVTGLNKICRVHVDRASFTFLRVVFNHEA